tara:strand:- start:127 stop:405 length:279 start_codon:yes stop_codon:yes gene_type:complete
MAFDQDIMSPLHDLATELLAKRQYGRLAIVTHYLSVVSAGQWDRLGSDERKLFVDKMASDFHARAWDDWEWDAGGALSRLKGLIGAQVRAFT